MNYRRLYPILLTLVIVFLLYFSGPSTAVLVSLTPAGSHNLGRTSNFQLTVDIREMEIIPITSVNLTIVRPSGAGTIECVLPYNGSGTQTVNCTASQNITVTLTPSGSWDYGLGHAYQYGFGYGYAYNERTNNTDYWTTNGTGGFGGQGYGYLWGIGYGTALGAVAAQTNYSINWTIPPGYAPGVYYIQTTVYAGGGVTYSTLNQSFTVSPGGITNPYTVYGYVNYTNNTHPRGLNITLTNLGSGEALNLTDMGADYDNSTGYFQFEAANYPTGYINGDTLRLEINITGGKSLQKMGSINIGIGETDFSTITAYDVLISEILPNAIGADNVTISDDNNNSNDGEWLEIRNKENGTTINVSGWNISDSDGNVIAINTNRLLSNSTLLINDSYLAVYRNGHLNFTINDDIDTLTLTDNTGVNQYSISYDADDPDCINATEPTGQGIIIQSARTFKEGWSIILLENNTMSVTDVPTPGGPTQITVSTPLGTGWNLVSFPLVV
ncbi:MAG: lamin tail domain-containing protein [Candidatus Altiarchaeota archaeon]